MSQHWKRCTSAPFQDQCAERREVELQGVVFIMPREMVSVIDRSLCCSAAGAVKLSGVAVEDHFPVSRHGKTDAITGTRARGQVEHNGDHLFLAFAFAQIGNDGV